VPGRVRAIPYLAGQVRRRHFAIESSSAVQKDCFTIPPSNLTLIDFPVLVVTLILSPSISLFSLGMATKFPHSRTSRKTSEICSTRPLPL
jgi:hypothetical protein